MEKNIESYYFYFNEIPWNAWNSFQHISNLVGWKRWKTEKWSNKSISFQKCLSFISIHYFSCNPLFRTRRLVTCKFNIEESCNVTIHKQEFAREFEIHNFHSFDKLNSPNRCCSNRWCWSNCNRYVEPIWLDKWMFNAQAQDTDWKFV